MKLLSILNYASKANVIPKVKKLPSNSDRDKKAELIKKLNKENKLLFGPVMKINKKGKQKMIDAKKVSLKTTTEREKSSEFYWLIQHKPDTLETDNKNGSDKTDLKILNTNCTDSSIILNDSNRNQKINDKNSNEQLNNFESIPFSSKGFAQIFKFPLVLEEKKDLIELSQGYEGKLPSVGTILTATMSDIARKLLIEWKLSKIKELGEEGFNKLQQEHLRKGRELHKALESYLKLNIEPEPETDVFKTWQSITPILKELNPRAELIEKFVEHPFLKYRGVVDSVSHIGSNLSVIEWKKSDKPKTDISKTYDAPIQLAAYLGALNSDPKYKFSLKTGYVAVAYTDGKPGDLFQINELEMQKYWQIWLQRLQEYWIRRRDGTLPDLI